MRLSRWIAIAAIVTQFATGCKRGDDESASKKHPDPAVVTRTAEGETIIRIADEAQQRIGLRTEGVGQASLAPELVAYGHLEEDPSHSFTLRSPLSGASSRASRRRTA